MLGVQRKAPTCSNPPASGAARHAEGGGHEATAAVPGPGAAAPPTEHAWPAADVQRTSGQRARQAGLCKGPLQPKEKQISTSQLTSSLGCVYVSSGQFLPFVYRSKMTVPSLSSSAPSLSALLPTFLISSYLSERIGCPSPVPNSDLSTLAGFLSDHCQRFGGLGVGMGYTFGELIY